MKPIDVKKLLISESREPTMWSADCSIPYFNKTDALSLISLCEANSIGILGFEGFEIRNGSILPLMDWIADFSSLLDSDDFIEKSTFMTKELINESPNSISFEFTLVKNY